MIQKIHDIQSKEIINRLYTNKYDDICDRGKYLVVWNTPYMINFLKNTDIHFDVRYGYIPPIEVEMVNIVIDYIWCIPNYIWKQYKYYVL